MSAEQNLATVKGIYEAFGSGDVAAILDTLADDVDWAADADSDVAPWYGARHTNHEVAAFFEAIGGALEVLEFRPLGFATSDDEVMVLLAWRAKSKATGREISSNLHHYWHLTDGKVDKYRGSEDTAQTAAALSG
ncbi:MAG: uncharacterized protein QOI10_1156 [Solirubrobacterales bacterium]|jgi:ketosteroid isomerase-like protein|nr:uncharacterized protein [Solirubrobacterales bacterium]